MPNILPFSPPKDRSEKNTVSEPLATSGKKQFFFTIILTDTLLQSALVAGSEQGAQVKEVSQIHKYFDRKDLLEQLDQSLQELGPDSEDVTETVFAFDQNWLQDGELKDDKKVIVKELAEQLSLEALGQCSIPEALAEARLMANEHDSCFIFYLQEQHFQLVFLKHGQLLDVLSIGRSAHFLADATEAFARAAKDLREDGQYFPEKILLCSLVLSDKELQNLRQELAKFSWTENPGFLQTPDIAVLEGDYIINSMSLGAGKVLTNQSFHRVEPKKTPVETSPIAPENSAEFAEKPSELAPVSAADEELAVELPEAKSFGIPFSKQYFEQRALDPLPDQESSAETSKPSKKRSQWQRFLLQHKKALIFGALSGFLALLLLLVLYSFFFAKVLITVSPKTQLLQEESMITLAPNAESSDYQKLLLKASLEEKTLSGEDVLTTTGVTLVGDKATGKVTLFNKTKAEKTWNAGTQLTADGDLHFVFNETVTLPAATEKSGGDGLDYGKLETSVTAAEIGAESNLKKETKLRVDNSYDDEFSATVLEDFTGGSSREVKVVAKEDQDKLAEQLAEKLNQEALKEYAAANGGGTYYVPTGIYSFASKNFSAKVGDEADSLTLKADLNVQAVKYTSSDLKELAYEVLKNELPEGYEFSSEDPSLLSDAASASADAETIQMKVQISNKAQAKIDQDALRASLLGESLESAKQQLANNQALSQYTLHYQPAFLDRLLSTLPKQSQRLLIKVE
jgi:hypothetical protein